MEGNQANYSNSNIHMTEQPLEETSLRDCFLLPRLNTINYNCLGYDEPSEDIPPTFDDKLEFGELPCLVDFEPVLPLSLTPPPASPPTTAAATNHKSSITEKQECCVATRRASRRRKMPKQKQQVAKKYKPPTKDRGEKADYCRKYRETMKQRLNDLIEENQKLKETHQRDEEQLKILEDRFASMYQQLGLAVSNLKPTSVFQVYAVTSQPYLPTSSPYHGSI